MTPLILAADGLVVEIIEGHQHHRDSDDPEWQAAPEAGKAAGNTVRETEDEDHHKRRADGRGGHSDRM